MLTIPSILTKYVLFFKYPYMIWEKETKIVPQLSFGVKLVVEVPSGGRLGMTFCSHPDVFPIGSPI